MEASQLADRVHEPGAGPQRPGAEVRACPLAHHPPVLDTVGLVELPRRDPLNHALNLGHARNVTLWCDTAALTMEGRCPPGGYSPVSPSTDSRRRSAWPLCRAYSSTRWNRIHRRLGARPSGQPVPVGVGLPVHRVPWGPGSRPSSNRENMSSSTFEANQACRGSVRSPSLARPGNATAFAPPRRRRRPSLEGHRLGPRSPRWRQPARWTRSTRRTAWSRPQRRRPARVHRKASVKCGRDRGGARAAGSRRARRPGAPGGGPAVPHIATPARPPRRRPAARSPAGTPG